MNKILRRAAVAAVAAAVSVTGAVLAPTNAHASDSSFVCKFKGTPGVNEVLKPGKNPISVGTDLPVGAWFNDAQGRSIVLVKDVGQKPPSVLDCLIALSGSGDW